MAKKKQKQTRYLPLKIVDYIGAQSISENILDGWINRGLLPRDILLREYADFIFSSHFLDKTYTGRFSAFNQHILSPAYIEKLLKNIPQEFGRQNTSRPQKAIKEIRDWFGITPVVTLWSQYKQVYKVDKDFFAELIRTKNISIPMGTLQHIPVADLYIDLSGISDTEPVRGVFIHVFYDNLSGDQFTAYMITDEGTSFSYYSNFVYNDKIAAYPEKDTASAPFMALDLTPIGYPVAKPKNYQKDYRYDIAKAVTQILVFLSSGMNDIQENPVTKSTYRPSSVIKNKFSEVQMWDVGVRYGKAIKLSKQLAEDRIKQDLEQKESGAIVTAGTENEQATDEGRKRNKLTKKSPRPHVRCAHWQTYHVGKGRLETCVKWIPPVIVCGDVELPVVIHNID